MPSRYKDLLPHPRRYVNDAENGSHDEGVTYLNTVPITTCPLRPRSVHGLAFWDCNRLCQVRSVSQSIAKLYDEYIAIEQRHLYKAIMQAHKSTASLSSVLGLTSTQNSQGEMER